MSESRAVVVYEPPTAKVMGRPTLYTVELGERICETIKTSDRGLDFICEAIADFPSSRTVYRWLDEHPDFCQNLARAREAQADFLMDQNFEIADDSSGDFRTIHTRNGPMRVFDPEAVQRAKLRIDVRTRFAAKINRAKWGESVAFTGPDGGPIQIEAVRESIAGKLDSLRTSLGRAREANQPTDD